MSVNEKSPNLRRLGLWYPLPCLSVQYYGPEGPDPAMAQDDVPPQLPPLWVVVICPVVEVMVFMVRTISALAVPQYTALRRHFLPHRKKISKMLRIPRRQWQKNQPSSPEATSLAQRSEDGCRF